MSYPDGPREWEENSYNVKKLADYISRINEDDLNISISLDKQELYDEAERLREQELQNVISIGIDDYVFNNQDKAETIIETKSIEKRTSLLGEVQENLQERFKLTKKETPDYDELHERIKEKL